MPGGDRTGPMGEGPMTGRAAGYCTGSPAPGYTNTAPGGYFGSRGRGFQGQVGGGRGGRGRRNRFYATGWGFGPYAIYGAPSSSSTTREEEMELLRDQAGQLSKILEDIKKRIEELDVQEKEE